MTARLPDQRGYYSVSEAAALLGVSRISIWRWIRAGRIPMARLGHRTTRIKREDLERLLGERRVGLAPQPSAWAEVGPSEHVVQFYESDGFLLNGVCELIALSLREGDAGIVVATPEHRAVVAERLLAADVDVRRAQAEDRFFELDAAETLACFMEDGLPSAERFAEVLGPLVVRAAEGGRRVRVSGEMVGLLAAEGNHAAAIRLEELWNDLQTRYPFSLFCGYPIAGFDCEALGEALNGVCATHSRVMPAESYATLGSADDRLRRIALLQQKARSLEVEVAERERIEEQLRVALEAERAARATAERALNVRDEFLSVASHELKTPLTALSAYAQLALRRLKRDGHIDQDRVEQALQTITGQAERLTRLLGQLLDISRLESGHLSLESQPTDVRALVRQVLTAAEASTDQHPFAFEAPLPLEAVVDPLRLEQVLVNLVDNAIKYSPEGGQIEVVLSQPTREVFELSVRDHGLGIPPEKRGQIFERFYQAHANAHKSGMGLGLYITDQIVELHGGRIRAEFPTDGGTRFVVRLPVGADS
jgi:excisionase family DNA binding protein